MAVKGRWKQDWIEAGTLRSKGMALLCLAVAISGLTQQATATPMLKFKADARPADPSTFPVAVWLQDPRMAGRYQAAGINLYVGLWKGPTERQLAALKAARMPVICDQNEIALSSPSRDIIVAYMHGDEPDNAQRFAGYWGKDVRKIKAAWPDIYQRLNLSSQPYKGYGPPVPPKWTMRDYQQIKKKDQTKPVMLNLGQGVAWEKYHGRGERTGKLEDYPQYIKGCDLVSFDIYPACHDNAEVAGNLWYVARGVERLTKWTGSKKPVWSCIECTRISHPQGKMATPGEVKAEVWMALTNGASGLIYFVHEFKPRFNEHALLDNAEMLSGVTAVNRQLQELAPVLNAPAQAGLATVVTENQKVPVSLLAKKYRGSTYLFAVGMRRQATTAEFTLNGISRATAEVIGENRTVAVRGGKFKDQFPPYGVHLYRIK